MKGGKDSYLKQRLLCATICITNITSEKAGESVYIEIDFNSEEALYLQVRNQIIHGIATLQLQEGDELPSVRQMADEIGINMHTVNKAYTVLKQEGFIQLDRRKGAVISLDMDKFRELQSMREQMKGILAKGICKGICKDEVYELVNEIYQEYGGE